jgi:hypothetical protein
MEIVETLIHCLAEIVEAPVHRIAQIVDAPILEINPKQVTDDDESDGPPLVDDRVHD